MTVDTFRIENDAEERGRNHAMLISVLEHVAQLRADVRRISWIAVPISCVALVVALIALVIVLLLAGAQLAPRGALTAPTHLLASLPAGLAALPVLPDRRRGLPLLLCILGYLAALALLADVALRVF